ncbi:hypothetical protein BO94DRAFT_587817 [Aspergillus sclerotioniger CBS 115572]|uniref:Uncharacterized protein n=1 Tax=Aspergillus sclerotioniger CBS 115572 TaxID=1450535 RepID=A0A317W142_9EURO|nr:hypothetical protein BO94DRAFT_587817 [Aspergillus sclerotioniger CBS 115572]PWY80364.1 hypothetical protein BO94DRAFT_587817 [Aspergillus sclerotioniger CBS 115572]
MGVSNPVKYVRRLSLFTKRTEQSTWKGKEIDSDPPIEVRWSAVQCPDDFALTDAHMAVSPSGSDLGHSSSSRNSSSSSSGSSSRTGLVRIVSWASLVGDRCRWTMEQERKLAIARSELARCQKAWSSEQELWLAHIKDLHEEKEAHEQFLHHRAKQQDEEQQHFRKSWIRRKSYEEQQQQQQQQQPIAPTQRTNSRLRRIRRMGS